MKENIIKDKSFAFAIQVVKLYQYLSIEKKEFILSKQLLRSGTSIGAMIREAEHAESKNDFIHKFAIAQKEANETVYWLELLKATNYLNEKEFATINNDAISILKLITSIIKTTKSQIPPKQPLL
ncbi:four helix bundle protein [Flavobacterium sp. N502536]|uniref:four helix bundle protein n=1 Tax=Flavobacterium sp. N502536 TaxID=2986837 RepID=UPI0022224EC6|nr:four helix bundle protein [Flavobacterium sp. N502536]